MRWLVLLVPGALAAQEPLQPAFVEETATSGVSSIYQGDWEFMVGGGVATFDCSGDGFPDLYLAGGTDPARLYVNDSTVGGPLAFTETRGGVEETGVTGAYPLDVDGDGITDLAVLRVGENRLYRGLGDCRFEVANDLWGFDGGDAWSTAFAASWEAGQDWPTLAVANYIDRTEDLFPWGSCTDNWLHRPQGRAFGPPLPLTPSHCALSILFTDWNRSGAPALRVSNDREYYKGGEEQLWHLAPGEAPRLYTAAEGWARLRIWGMGIATADLTGDGYPDYYLTSMADNRMQVLSDPAAGRPGYVDQAFARGITAHRPHVGGEIQPSTAWHAQFEDVNNDRLWDLFVAKGNVAEMPDFARRDPDNLLVQRPDGTFREDSVAAGVASMETGRGAMLADLNLDGLLDLVVVNRWAPAQLFRNVTAGAGNWVQVRLSQPGPNRDGIGAWVELRADGLVTRREILVGGGHVSGHLGWWHLGLGGATAAELRVLWPDGSEGPWQPVAANGFYLLAPGAEPQVVTPD